MNDPAVQKKPSRKNSRKRQYFVSISSIIVCVICDSLARMEPTMYGFKWLLIFALGGLAAVAGVFKLRRLIHGTGWDFPNSDTVIISALTAQCWLYLIFQS